MNKYKLTILSEFLKEKKKFQQRKMWWAAIKQQQVIRYLPTTRTIYVTMQLIILVVCKLPAYPYISKSL